MCFTPEEQLSSRLAPLNCLSAAGLQCSGETVGCFDSPMQHLEVFLVQLQQDK